MSATTFATAAVMSITTASFAISTTTVAVNGPVVFLCFVRSAGTGRCGAGPKPTKSLKTEDDEAR